MANATGRGFREPVARPVRCGIQGPGTAKPPERCDDTAYGEGRGGRLSYAVDVPAGGSRTLWIGVAGSDTGVQGARAELAALLADPESALAAKVAGREAPATRTRLEPPGDPQLAQGIDWSKQNLADSVQEAADLQVREVRAGKRYPRPKGQVGRVRYLGAGWPDYPWLVGTDASTPPSRAWPSANLSPSKTTCARCATSPGSPTARAARWCTRSRATARSTSARTPDPGNTDESAKFPSAVALLWRWTGDDAFRDEMYPFAKANLEFIARELDGDRDGCPGGLGNVEREGMGEEKLDAGAAGPRPPGRRASRAGPARGAVLRRRLRPVPHGHEGL